ncbi:NADH-quinone oxidoreductase subunit I [Nautilia sp. PV-1]|jgi:NADH-quinone oxidoreductase subunit I|uniref:4Fe-4S binding protein n=1 Tax=Nautilia sp. PV-1 TaxID=2579250 RepID=UPI000FDC1D5D|nr:4Fe-4S binding protein [Nautilia sp. PV-1]AZV47109.1 NADH-quinone oxidoreductase subunit I [Nautilia sp. PV-1]
MFFNVVEKIIRVTKAFKEPRVATKDVTHETMHQSPVFRGKHEIRYDICTGCEACAKICPVDAIIMEPLPIKRPKALPEVNLGICIFCGLCEDVCPTKPEKAIKLSGGTFEMITGGTDDDIKNYWVKPEVPAEWIEQKKKEEEEKARKKAEMLAKKKAEAEAKKKAEAEAKAKEEAEKSAENTEASKGDA